MSKKARRRPSWKKDNFRMAKGWCWSTELGYLMVWPKCVEKELEEVLRRNFQKELEHEQESKTQTIVA